jgi:2-amino-4-hydroxy-6-hydroxymethyldihydropteridine diphosphokinase
MVDVVVGLGANLGNPAAAFSTALDRFASTGDVVSVSRLWRTRPLGPDQPDYCNAAVLVEWPGDLPTLLHACRDLEIAAGRDRDTEQRWGPRVLDLDLLAARDLVWRGPELEIPHPRLHERAFALVPAAEIVADWIHPIVGKTIEELAEEVLAAAPDALVSSEPFPVAIGFQRL